MGLDMVMVSTIKSLLFGACLYAAGSDAAVRRTESSVKEYDYIVVGGGTAGLALSTRLSQGLPHSTILVIEAGSSALGVLGVDVPGKKGSTLGTQYDWNFTTIPQAAAKGRIFAQNRGHILGGSSAINLLTYDRSSKQEYDGWDELGNPGWGFDDFLHYLNKAENFTSENTEYYTNGIGIANNGPIRGTITRFIPPQQAGWFPALNSLGVPNNTDYMSGNPLGVLYTSTSINPTHYNRSYSASEYLPLAGPKLTVMTDTRVAKVNLKKTSRGYTAIGVTLADGTVINAKKEIISSCGSFLSPVLLEASGIGSKSVLQAAGITQLIDLPGVGENLQDHIRIQTSYQLKPQFTSVDILRYNATFAAAQLQLWIDNERSIYDYTGSAYTFQTWKQALGDDSVLRAAANASADDSPANQKKLQWMADSTVPQLEVILSDGYTGVKGYPLPASSLYGKDFFSLLAVVMHPLSRGSVHINSTNPLSNPIINPNYLSNDYDIQAAIAAVKKARQIALLPPIQDVWINEYEPGLDAVNTDAQWKDFVLNTTLTIYHPAGTCAMMPEKDSGVVDPNLVVYGTTNLRVVDASIMPVLISAHLQTAVYGIAEKAAAMIIHADNNN